MPLSNYIRIILIKRGNISISGLAKRIGVSPQNMHSRFKRDNFTEKELLKIAETLDCTLKIEFVDNKTGETI